VNAENSFDLGNELEKLENEGKISLLEVANKTHPVEEPINTGLQKFPLSIMGGVAGDFAKLYNSYLEPPKEFFFFSFLTCLGAALANRLTLASEIKPQPRFYTLILGESADDRKSTAAMKTVDFFKETLQDFKVCYGVGSAEGLQERINECTPHGLLLVFDELKAFVSKCKIEASVLLPCVNTLFESNRYESRTKKSDIFLENASLSILSASTISTYENMWSTQFTDIGFNNRLFIVPASGERRHSIPKKIPQDEKDFLKKQIGILLQQVGNYCELNFTENALKRYDQWYLSLEGSIHTKRLDIYALRFMPLVAINDGKTEIDVDVVEKVIGMMNWQLAVRKQYDPIDADNEVARMENRIRRCLHSQSLGSRDLKRRCNVNRYGIWVFDTALKNLQKADEVNLDNKTQMWRRGEGVINFVIKSKSYPSIGK